MSKEVISKFGTVKHWLNYSQIIEMSTRFSKFEEKLILCDIKNNTIANPKSVLNTLSLHITSEDRIELIVMGEWLQSTKNTTKEVTDFLSEYVNFDE